MVVLRSTKGRFGVAAILPVRVPLHTVEESNQPVGGVESSLRRLLNLTPELGI